MSSSVCRGGVACVCWWLGGNCYHRRCVAACRRRVGGLWSQTPRVLAWKGQGRVLFRWLCWSCSACLRVFVVVLWLVFVGGLGGIATIGAALRRVAGVSGVYGRKPPAWLLGWASVACPWRGLWSQTPRVFAQSAGDLGGMRVTWGVWGVVDYGLGVGVWGDGGVVARPCAVEGFVLPPDTPSDHLRCPGRQVRSGRPTVAELPPHPPLPASPEPRVGQDVSGNTRGPLACASQNPTGAGKGPSVAWGDADGPQTQHEAHKPSEGRSRARRRPIVPRQFIPVDQPRIGVVTQWPRP